MSRQAQVSHEAKADLREIRDHVAAFNVEAAKKLTRQIAETFDNLGDMPMVGRERDDLAVGLRSLVVGKYIVIYRLPEDKVEIVRDLHGARALHGARDIPSFFGEGH